jgi:hypothetical protein
VATFGWPWYFDPTRWTTVDGFAPWQMVLCSQPLVRAVDARQTIATARAIALVLGEDGPRELETLWQRAWGQSG